MNNNTEDKDYYSIRLGELGYEIYVTHAPKITVANVPVICDAYDVVLSLNKAQKEGLLDKCNIPG